MDKKFNFSAKHLAIGKANAQIVIAVGAASFIVIFCLVASKAIFSQYNYQSRVIAAVKTADNQLDTNITTYHGLVQSYTKFNSASPNVIGNPVTGTSNDNTQVILDALPGAYDFPALATSLEYILTATGTQGEINGNDTSGISSVTAPSTTATTSSTGSAVSIPFGFSITDASYGSAQTFLQYLQQSIRPMPVDSMTLTGSQGSLSMTIDAHTYYQPAKTLNISKEAVQ